MNYAQHLQELMDEIKADKSLPQPLKNYILSDAGRLQAMCRAAMVTTGLKAPEGLNIKHVGGTECTCPEGGVRANCPVHGTI